MAFCAKCGTELVGTPPACPRCGGEASTVLHTMPLRKPGASAAGGGTLPFGHPVPRRGATAEISDEDATAETALVMPPAVDAAGARAPAAGGGTKPMIRLGQGPATPRAAAAEAADADEAGAPADAAAAPAAPPPMVGEEPAPPVAPAPPAAPWPKPDVPHLAPPTVAPFSSEETPAPPLPGPAAAAFSAMPPSPRSPAGPVEGATVFELPSFARELPAPDGWWPAVPYALKAATWLLRSYRQLRELRGQIQRQQALLRLRQVALADATLALEEFAHPALDEARTALHANAEDLVEAERALEAAAKALGACERDYGEAIAVLEQQGRDRRAHIAELEQRRHALERQHAARGRPAVEHAPAPPPAAGRPLMEPTMLDAAAGLLDRQLEELRVELEAARAEEETGRQDLAARRQQHVEEMAARSAERAAVVQRLDDIRARHEELRVILGQRLDRERSVDPRLVRAYQALDEISGTLTGLEMRMAELIREKDALDRRALVRGSVILGGAALLLLVVVVVILAVAL